MHSYFILFLIVNNITKANGKIIELMVKANSLILMEMYMKANGLKTKQMDMEFIPISTAVATRASGLLINNMDLELNSGLMVPNTTVNTSKE